MGKARPEPGAASISWEQALSLAQAMNSRFAILAGLVTVMSPLVPAQDPGAFVRTYCTGCHNPRLRASGVVLDDGAAANAGAAPELWERVIARLRAGSMPPPGLPRATAAEYRAVIAKLEGSIDKAAAARVNPGRIAAVHRLNRTEYNNAVRDLFDLDIDVKPQLPGDETADGSFDNFAAGLSLATAHIERYLSVARQVTRLAAGLPPSSPGAETHSIPLHVLQNDRQSEDLPLGSRGGIAVRHWFPVTGDYSIKVRLQRQYQDYLKGMGWPQQLDVRLDGKLLQRFTVGGGAKGRAAGASYAGDGEPGYAGDPEWERYMQVEGDSGIEVRVRVDAGPKVVGVSFVRAMWEPEGLPQPLQRGRVIANDQVYMDYANVASVQIGGPYGATGNPSDTPSRRAVFVCSPKSAAEEHPCATKILKRMATRAYRRPATPADVRELMAFFERGRQEGGTFNHGVQFSLERMLVDPDFLLRLYRDPGEVKSDAVYPLRNLELASRLSFFLWSSIPDERLIELAARGELGANLRGEAQRMFADPRAARALVDGFAAQWLNLRRVGEVVVDPERYPNYDQSLLEAFEEETRLFVTDALRANRGVVELLDADYTFVNERLARHYGIAGVYGSRFRRVALANREQRGGLLGQGALLATTSYPDRTSPVLRGKWLLNNILGLTVPPPPPGLDTNLDDKPGARAATIRERLAMHRRNPACNSCHAAIDPLGFALENFDVIGGWRDKDEAGRPVDSVGETALGETLVGLRGLRTLLLADREAFPRTVTAKLLAYALGRRLEYYDQPVVRKIVRDAAADGYRWSAIIAGIVESPPFRLRAARRDEVGTGGGK